jgi:hypothetical protein
LSSTIEKILKSFLASDLTSDLIGESFRALHMASEETVTSILQWEIQANCTQLPDKCMPLLERIFPHRILTYDWAVVYTDHPEFMHNLCRRSKLIRFEHTHHSEFIHVAMEVEEEQRRYGGNR